MIQAYHISPYVVRPLPIQVAILLESQPRDTSL